MKPEITQRLTALEKKYDAMGQDIVSYLDGLLYSNYLTYWDYIHTDKLLSLQNTRTDFPDELIFIMYHQVTELYFRLCLHELEQICHNGRNITAAGQDLGWNEKLEAGYFIARLNRLNRYFEALTKSFGIMVDGMEPGQFLKFRMALLPASGFQSAQYRMIEICSTSFANLVHPDERQRFSGKQASVADMFKYIYWKRGATELETGKKTLTLKQFEKKYSAELIEMAEKYRDINLWAQYMSLEEQDRGNPELREAMRQYDKNVNVNWPLVHIKSAARYLQKATGDVAATGGTNWQKYLPPRHQRRIFYPELWNEEELENWGKPETADNQPA